MVEILDSTLPEGKQTPYVNFLPGEKVEIARLLDRGGVEMIESGDPSVSPTTACPHMISQGECLRQAVQTYNTHNEATRDLGGALTTEQVTACVIQRLQL